MIINGKEMANEFAERMKQIVDNRPQNIRPPRLVVLLVGDRPDSLSYVKNKQVTGSKIGIDVSVLRFPEEVSTEELISAISMEVLSADGIIVQLPLPKHIDQKYLMSLIPPELDVDGLTPASLGELVKSGTNSSLFMPCTPNAVIAMIESTGFDLSGSNVVLIGCGELVGKPLAIMLMHKNATVICCNKETQNIESLTRLGDVVVVATGCPKLVKKSWIKPGAIVIDVGISTNEKRQLVGDVDFDAVKDVASAISPVPGGVGPMTVVMLMQSVITRWKSSSFTEQLHYD